MEQLIGCGPHLKHGPDTGNRQGRPVSDGRTLGQLRRVGATGVLQWWSHAHGQVCGNVNRKVKWAFVEIGNLIVINQHRLAGTHAVRLYQRIKRAKNHQKAVVAVAHHLAEATWWVLTKQAAYREPQGPRQQALSSTHG